VEIPQTQAEARQQVRAALKRPGRLFRRFRRVVRVGFVLLCLVPVAAVILTQGPVPRWLLGREASRATGGHFSSAWVKLTLDGRLVIDRPKLDAPGVAGEAGEVFSARSVVVNLDWSAWAAGVVVPTEVRVIEPLLRLSVDAKTNALNLAQLTPGAGEGGGGGMLSRVPRLEVERGRVAIGEHDQGRFTLLTELAAKGWVSPLAGQTAYWVRLRADDLGSMDQAGQAAPIDLDGRIDFTLGRGVVRVSSVELSRWAPSRVPSVARELWERLALRGRIEQTELRYDRVSGLTTRLRLSDVALRVPVAAGRTDVVGERNPRMDAVSGTLSLTTGGPGAGLEADLSGSLEDLPARVRLSTQGLGLSAGYRAVITAEQFKLEKDPRILWFTPDAVRMNFDRFSGPTALVDARIELNRAAPEGDPANPGALVPGETSIRGTLILRNGTAAFAKFPYPLQNLSGTVTFDDDQVSILGVRGVGPTGARVVAEGSVSPPTMNARINIDVTVTDLPLDDVLAKAIAASKGKELADWIFSRPAYDRLLATGRVISSARKAELAAQLDALRQGPAAADDPARASEERALLAALEVPVYDFGGTLDSLSVHVRSDFGFDSDTRSDIRVRFKQAAILTKLFAYPINATALTLRITDDFAVLFGRGLRGVTGGSTDIDARVDIKRTSGGEWAYEPNVAVRATGVPIDALLIGAIPDAATVAKLPDAEAEVVSTQPNTQPNSQPDVQASVQSGDQPAETTAARVKRVLTSLNVVGDVDANIDVSTPPGAGTTAGATITLNGLSLRPPPLAVITGVVGGEASGRPLLVRDVRGVVRLDEQRIELDGVRLLLDPSEASDADAFPPVPTIIETSGAWLLKPPVPVGGQAPAGGDVPAQGADASNRLSVSGRNVDLALQFESLLAPLSLDAATSAADARQTLLPRGRIDVDLQLEQTFPAGAAAITEQRALIAKVFNARNLGLLLEGQRVDLRTTEGAIAISTLLPAAGAPGPAAPLRVRLDELRTELAVGDLEIGAIELDGAVALTLGAQSSAGPASGPGATRRFVIEQPLTAELRQMQVDSPLVRELTRRFASPQAVAMVARLAPTGEFDAEATARTIDGRDDPMVTLKLRPAAAAFTIDDRRYSFSTLSGQLVLTGPRGGAEQFTITEPGWSATLNGRFRTDGPELDGPSVPGGGWSLDGALNFDIAGLPESFAAMLPSAAIKAIDAARLRIDGGLSAQGLLLSASSRAGPEVPAVGAATPSGQSTAASPNDAAPQQLSASASGTVLLAGLSSTGGDGRSRADLAAAQLTLDAWLERAAGSTRLSAQAQVAELDAAVMGLVIRDAAASLRAAATLQDAEPAWSVSVDTGSASLYGGRVSFEGQAASSQVEGAPAQYQVLARAAGVRLTPLLADLQQASDAFVGPATPAALRPDESLPRHDVGESRGLIRADLTLRGPLDPAAGPPPEGRLSVRIAGGRGVLDAPALVGALQLSNLQLPVGERFDYVAADGFLREPGLTIERLVLLSPSVAVVGIGTVAVPSLTLDLRLNSRSRSRVPMLTDLIETFRDELLTTSVIGTLSDPVIQPQPLTSTRRLLARLLGMRDVLTGVPDVDLAPFEADRASLGAGGAAARHADAVPAVKK